MKIPKFHLSIKIQLIILFIVFVFIVIFVQLKPRPRLSPPLSSPSSGFNLDNLDTLKVVKSIPENNQYHNPFDPLEITFNQAVNPQTLSYTLDPNTKVELKAGSLPNILIITPQPKFTPETEYTLTLTTQPPYILKFITQVEAGNVPQWNEQFNQQLNDYIQNYGAQDKALAKIRKSAPINETGFTINYSYKNNAYTITLIQPYDQNKTKALDWFRNQGVTNFDHLRIEWKQQ